jgi:hypothetical protein
MFLLLARVAFLFLPRLRQLPVVPTVDRRTTRYRIARTADHI